MHRYRICAVVVVAAFALGCLALPEAQLPEDEGRTLVALDQQWNGYQRELYYHQTQGSVLLPYKWLMALEQPEIKFFGEVGMFLDEDYIMRFGFLPGRPIPATPGDTSGFESPPVDCTPSDDPNHIDYNCGLPVGFSRAEVPLMRGVFEEDSVGLTCAACHTTELHFEDKAIRIDDATSLIDPTAFQTAVGGAMFLTQNLPFRFNRFADRVLGEEASDAERDALRTGQMSAVLGECSFDFTDARRGAGPIVVGVFALAGRIRITVPDDWVVDARVLPLLGKVADRRDDNDASAADDDPAPAHGAEAPVDLLIQGTAILGGVEVVAAE